MPAPRAPDLGAGTARLVRAEVGGHNPASRSRNPEHPSHSAWRTAGNAVPAVSCEQWLEFRDLPATTSDEGGWHPHRQPVWPATRLLGQSVAYGVDVVDDLVPTPVIEVDRRGVPGSLIQQTQPLQCATSLFGQFAGHTGWRCGCQPPSSEAATGESGGVTRTGHLPRYSTHPSFPDARPRSLRAVGHAKGIPPEAPV